MGTSELMAAINEFSSVCILLLISIILIDQVRNNDVSTAESGSEVDELLSSRAPGPPLELKLMPVDEEVSTLK